MEMKLKLKAYKCYGKDWDDYCIHYPSIILADSREKAKALFDNDCNLMSISWNDRVAIRLPEEDIYEFNGLQGTKKEIANTVKRIDRRLKILDMPDDQYYYIQDASAYCGNMVVWWENEGSGYTPYIEKAWCLSGAKIKSYSWRESEVFWKKEDVEKCISKHVDIQNLNKGFESI